MKKSVRAYAQALLDLTQDASKKDIEVIVNNFLKELRDRHLISKVPAIISEFEKLSDYADKIVKAQAISAHKLSKDVLKEASLLVTKRTGAKEVVWEEIVDEDVLGGIIIKAKDFIIDMSLANRVNGLTLRIKE